MIDPLTVRKDPQAQIVPLGRPAVASGTTTLPLEVDDPTNIDSTKNDSADFAKANEATDDDSSDDDSEDLTSFQNESLSELAFQNVQESIKKLWRLSHMIRNPSVRSGFLKARGYREFDEETGVDLSECFKYYDRCHVQAVLSQLQNVPIEACQNVYLVDRLAAANTQRRQQFGLWRYNERRLGGSPDPLVQPVLSEVVDSNIPPQPREISMSMPDPATTVHVQNIQPHDDDATSAVSTVSTRSFSQYHGEGRPFIPMLPSSIRGKPFNCPYCGIQCSARISRFERWETHVSKDLRPYICVIEKCATADQQYGSFNAWSYHELNHRRSSQSQQTEHPAQGVSHEFSRCPLCLQENVTFSHVASHLSRIASFSLPRSTDIQEEGEGEARSVGADHDVQEVNEMNTVIRSLSLYDSDDSDIDESVSSESDDGSDFPDAGPYYFDTKQELTPSGMEAPGPGARQKALALFKAVVSEDIPRIRNLLRSGANTEVRATDGSTPLLIASATEQEEKVKQLLESGANVNALDKFRETPLLKAARAGNEKIVKLLLEAGAAVNMAGNILRVPLSEAIESGNEKIVHALLEAGADVQALDYKRRTPLLGAVYAQDERLVQVLLKAGADVHVMDDLHRTPLLKAVQAGNDKTVQALLEAGSDVHAADYLHRTPLWKAVKAKDEAIVQLLLKAGADVNTPDDCHQTPLLKAVKQGDEKIVHALLEAGADINTMDDQLQTPLLEAVKGGNEDIVSILLDAGADVTAKDYQHRTPLYSAVEAGNDKVVKLLLDAGAAQTIHSKGEDDETDALMLAASKGFESIVRLLVEAEADDRAENTESPTTHQ